MWYLEFTSLAIMVSLWWNLCDGQVQRLVQPSRGTKFTMSPGLSMPTMQLNTIESSMSMKMPISFRFPTVAEVAQSVFAAPSGHHQAKADNSSESRVMQNRVNSRARFYKAIETTHKTLGKSCLLRAICEVAEVPFISSHTGFLGEIFDILLTSSFLDDKFGKLTEFVTAEKVGRDSLLMEKDACKVKYRDCPFSIFRIASLADEFL